MVSINREPAAATRATEAYLRQVRRLRWTLRGRPARMYSALRQLAAQRPVDEASIRPGQVARIADRPHPAPVAHRSCLEGNPAEVVFLEEVRSELEGPILRYSCRQRLLRRAEVLGISRFQANLLIATAQHQACDTPVLRRAAAKPASWALLIALMFLLQAAILFCCKAAIG